MTKFRMLALAALPVLTLAACGTDPAVEQAQADAAAARQMAAQNDARLDRIEGQLAGLSTSNRTTTTVTEREHARSLRK